MAASKPDGNTPIDGPSSTFIIYDVDGDNNLDIVTFGWNGTILMKSDGNGSFKTSLVSLLVYIPLDFYASAAIGDLNGDDWPDLALTNPLLYTTDVMFGKCR